ncbi:MAG TPA: tetratricopeptide repeat protein [Blastocatellia bacterium]|nr:tetratricopeptide repeat protein [Blastocatellia bacterium]
MSAEGITIKPYLGLAPYSEEQALFFFGREKERKAITDNLLARRLTLLRGESGVGKSSVLSAGVSHDLRWLARENLDATGKPGLAALVFRSWKGDPVAELKRAVEGAVKKAFFGMPFEPVSQSLPLAETLEMWADRVGGELLIILDQFEEYFLNNGQEGGDGTFAAEFIRLMNPRFAMVSFLISIRSDCYEKLERFKKDIPNIFQHSLRIDHLDMDAAREAIQKPVEKYNHLFAAGRKRISIEPGLVDVILSELRELEGENRLEKAAANVEATEIKAPFLQLVMMRLWKEEMLSNSAIIRRETLERLGNAEGIVSKHLISAMNDLTPEEREIARRAFSHLVSPSEAKYAYSAPDLVRYVNVDEKKLEEVLEKLSRVEARILNAVTPHKSGAATRYEIFHDVLAKPIREYVQEAEKAEAARRAAEQEKAIARIRLRRVIAVAAILVTGLLALLLLLYVQQRIRNAETAKRTAEQKATQERDNRMAAEASLKRGAGAFNDVLFKSNDFEGSKTRFDEAILSYQEKGDRESEGIARMGLGGLHYRYGEYTQAAEEYKKAEEVLEKILEPEHRFLADVRNKLALAYYDDGKYSEVESLYKRAIEHLERAFDPWSKEVTPSLIGLGEFYQLQARYDEAEENFKRALAIHESSLGKTHQEVGIDLSYLAGVSFMRGRYDEAERLYREALAILEAALGPEHVAVSKVLGNLADVYSADGRYRAAQPLLLRVLDIQGREYGQTDYRFAQVESNMGSLFNEQGKHADALPLHKEALLTMEDFYREDHPSVAVPVNNLAYTYSKLGDCKEAMPLFKRALDIRRKSFEQKHQAIASSLNGLAECYRDTGRYAEAETHFKEALDIRAEKLGPDSPAVAATLESMGLLYFRQAKYAEAEQMLRRSLLIRQSALRPGHPAIAETLENLALLLRATNRINEAAEAEQQARQIRENNSRE